MGKPHYVSPSRTPSLEEEPRNPRGGPKVIIFPAGRRVHLTPSPFPAFFSHEFTKPFSFTLRRSLCSDRVGEGRRGSHRMNQRGTAELSVLHWSSLRKDGPRIICDYTHIYISRSRSLFLAGQSFFSTTVSAVLLHGSPQHRGCTSRFISLALSASAMRYILSASSRSLNDVTI